MIRTIGKAFYWQKLLDSGEVANATDLARQLKLEPGWVAEVLRLTAGNKSRAARVLGISRQGLIEKLRRSRTLDDGGGRQFS
jgi:DNA-binding protein Fis